MATSPDLPSPVAPDRPRPEDPSDLPVEPDDGVSPPMQARRLPAGRSRIAWHLQPPVHRQFMRAASYRWPNCRISATFF